MAKKKVQKFLAWCQELLQEEALQDAAQAAQDASFAEMRRDAQLADELREDDFSDQE